MEGVKTDEQIERTAAISARLQMAIDGWKYKDRAERKQAYKESYAFT